MLLIIKPSKTLCFLLSHSLYFHTGFFFCCTFCNLLLHLAENVLCPSECKVPCIENLMYRYTSPTSNKSYKVKLYVRAAAISLLKSLIVMQKNVQWSSYVVLPYQIIALHINHNNISYNVSSSFNKADMRVGSSSLRSCKGFIQHFPNMW